MNTATIIADLTKAFGFEREDELRQALGLRSDGAIPNWKRENHIPWRRRFQIETLARQHGVELPKSFATLRNAA